MRRVLGVIADGLAPSGSRGLELSTTTPSIYSVRGSFGRPKEGSHGSMADLRVLSLSHAAVRQRKLHSGVRYALGSLVQQGQSQAPTAKELSPGLDERTRAGLARVLSDLSPKQKHQSIFSMLKSSLLQLALDASAYGGASLQPSTLVINA